MREGLGLGTRAREEGRGEGLWVRGEDGWPAEPHRPGKREANPDVDWHAAVMHESTSSRGAERSGTERTTLRKRWVRLSDTVRRVRDAMIYHAVLVEGRSQRRVAQIWRLTPGRVSQIVKDMCQIADCASDGHDQIVGFVEEWREANSRELR
jgi:hypothetical protein